ncbi:MAG: TolC family protein, partial [Calditrichaeota bacterium]
MLKATMIRNGIPGILLIPLLLWGQSPLTLPEAWQIALRNNLTLQQQQDALAQAHREWQIQRSRYLPTFSINAAYSHVSEVARLEIPLPLPGLEPIEAGVKDQYDLSIGVTQPVFTGFRIRNLVRAAREQRQAAEIQAAVVKHQLLLQVGQLYYEIQQNLLQQAVLEQAIQRAEAHRQRVRNFFLAEQAAAFDTLEAANRKLQLISQLRQLQNLHRVLLTRFRHLLNTDAPLTIERMVVDTVETTLSPLESYLERAIQKRPELQQVAAVRRVQLFRGKALRSAYFPQIYARAAYHYARPGVDFFRKQWMDYYTVGVSLQWEI